MRLNPDADPLLAVLPFPKPDGIVEIAYAQLEVAANGTAKDVKALGDLNELPRPWMLETCSDPALRRAMWRWLDDVVTWLNHEYAWRSDFIIPGCWPAHPHLLHELAVLTDLRYRAGQALNAAPMEEWHRYVLPGFWTRLAAQKRTGCDVKHDSWPALSTFTETTRGQAHQVGDGAWRRDVDWLMEADHAAIVDPGQRPLRVVPTAETGERVDRVTGEVL